jgi:hypothetical protein
MSPYITFYSLKLFASKAKVLNLANGKIKDSKILNGDSLMEHAENAFNTLDEIKNKATLRTKDGTALASPVYEAIQNLEESWEEARLNGDVDDLKWRMEGFIDASLALNGALKDRNVILT